MKTEELIARLAADCTPVPRGAVERRLGRALAVGGGLALLTVVAWLGLRSLGDAAATASFWMKAAYTLTLAASGWVLTRRLARPDGKAGLAPLAALGALLAMAVLAIIELSQARGAADLWHSILGHTWRVCPLRILLLAAPFLFFTILGLRRLAPTRLAQAGAAAGLLAGGLGATVYGLHCEESAAAFVAIWYTLGVGLCAALGAAIGRLALRW